MLPGGLKNTILFLIFLEAKISKIKVLADSVPGEDPLPGLQLSTTWCPRLVGRESSGVTSSYDKGISPLGLGAHPCDCQALSPLHRPYLHTGCHSFNYEFWGDINIQFVTNGLGTMVKSVDCVCRGLFLGPVLLCRSSVCP